MRTLVFAGAKGGVGRTTVSGNVAAALAHQGTSTAWVTTAEGDWEHIENLTVFGCDADGLRQAINDAQAAVRDGIVVVDLPGDDAAPTWWAGDAQVIVVADGHAASLFAALETSRAWRDAQRPPAGFVLDNVAADTAATIAERFRLAVAQYVSMSLVSFGSVPPSAESRTLVNRGRFCKGKAAAVYAGLAKRLASEAESSGDKSDTLEGLRNRREQLRAA